MSSTVIFFYSHVISIFHLIFLLAQLVTANIGVDSSRCFPFTMRTDRHSWWPYLTYQLLPVWDNVWNAQHNSFNRLGHFKNVFDNDDDDEHSAVTCSCCCWWWLAAVICPCCVCDCCWSAGTAADCLAAGSDTGGAAAGRRCWDDGDGLDFFGFCLTRSDERRPVVFR